jgi:hypothetical protein
MTDRPVIIVKLNKSGDYNFFDGIDNHFILCHPNKGDSIQSLLWSWWKEKHPKEWQEWIDSEKAKDED